MNYIRESATTRDSWSGWEALPHDNLPWVKYEKKIDKAY